ncbi:MAG: hypothetical protein U0R19_11400 [Bryobacteraceae bacterium]
MDELSLIFNRQLNLPLSSGLPSRSWLRTKSRTRLLVIDDDIFDRRHLFPTGGSAIERVFEDRLNVGVEFFSMPEGYSGGPAHQRGLFTTSWFAGELERRLQNKVPVCAILLDLRFGLEDLGNPEEPIGAAFLQILDENETLREQGVPVIIASSMEEGPRLHDYLKRFGSYKKFIQKTHDVNLPEELVRALVQWGKLADPNLGAFSSAMRTVARSLRQVAVSPSQIAYENDSHQESESSSLLAPVVFTGELGSGKNWLASKLVQMSERASRHFDTFTFTSASSLDSTILQLFGGGRHSASQPNPYFVHPPTGFLLDRDYGRDSCVRLDSIGKVHWADVGTRRYTLPQANSGRAEPECGTLVLDELPEVREEYQIPFLEVLNHGRFTPNLSHTLPVRPEGRRSPGTCYRQLDVWFLFTCTKAGFDNRLRLDLKSRLCRYEPIEVPCLPNRDGDVVPLAVGMILDNFERRQLLSKEKMENLKRDAQESPEAVFKAGAIEVLEQLGHFASVRQLNGVINQLPGITHEVPFNARELEMACRHARLPLSAVQSAPQDVEPRVSKREIRTVLEWMGNVRLNELELKPESGLPGPCARAAAASVLLAQLDRALRDEFAGKRLEEMKAVPAASLWRRLWGETLESNIALSRIVYLLALDPAVTIVRAEESPFLRWLLQSRQMSARSKSMRDMAADFKRVRPAAVVETKKEG